ncbi:MAG: hypothetical protein AAFY76_03360 [Cyanobacteria bacterium J06649_11]
MNNLDSIDEEFTILPDLIVKNYQASSIREAIINLVNEQNLLERRGFSYT